MNPAATPMVRRAANGALAMACAVGLGAAATAQQAVPPGVDPTTPGAGLQQPQQVAPNAAGQTTFDGMPNTEGGFDPVWMVQNPRPFSGFPVFPSRLKGYGSYPLPGDPNAAVDPGALTPIPGMGLGDVPMPVVPVEAEPPDWPAWVRNQAKVALPFSPEVALLVGNNERVWWRATADEPFVPLFFYSKFATLPVGGEVEVRRSGEFELQLHTSTRIVARGRTQLRMVAMDEQRVNVEFDEFSWLRIQSMERAHAFTLPDGSVLSFEPPSADVVVNPFAALLGGAAPQPAAADQVHVELRRLDEPGWFGGRATMTNLGGRDVQWQHASGTVTLAPSQRVTLFLTPPRQPAVGAQLQAGGTIVQQQDGNVLCRGANSQEVSWCGAQVVLSGGTEVVFESLQGDAFAPPRSTSDGDKLSSGQRGDAAGDGPAGDGQAGGD